MRQESVKIAVTLDNDSVAIMTFLTLGRGDILPYGATWDDEAAGYWRREPTDVNIFAELTRAFAVGAQPTRFRRIAEGDVPADRTFRDALVDDGTSLKHDMPKARAIHLSRVRAARAARLEQLDRDWMRATGQRRNAEADAIEAQRQLLRDLPATLDVENAQTTDELKTRWSPVID